MRVVRFTCGIPGCLIGVPRKMASSYSETSCLISFSVCHDERKVPREKRPLVSTTSGFCPVSMRNLMLGILSLMV